MREMSGKIYDYKPVSSLWVKLMCNITTMFVVLITGLSFNFENMHTDTKSHSLKVFRRVYEKCRNVPESRKSKM